MDDGRSAIERLAAPTGREPGRRGIYLHRRRRARTCPTPDPAGSPTGSTGRRRSSTTPAFDWTDDDFQARPLSSALIYELHVGTFTAEGTFEAAIDRLDHLKALGVTHVEIMPVADFPGRFGWGYDGVNLFAPKQLYGGPEGLKRLVNACHARGLGGDPGRGLQPPGPVGQLPAEVRPLLHRPPPHPLGRRPELRRPVQRRGPPLLLRQRPDVAPRLPHRRPPARRRPRDRRHLRRHRSWSSWPPRSTSSRPTSAGTWS